MDSVSIAITQGTHTRNLSTDDAAAAAALEKASVTNYAYPLHSQMRETGSCVTHKAFNVCLNVCTNGRAGTKR